MIRRLVYIPQTLLFTHSSHRLLSPLPDLPLTALQPSISPWSAPVGPSRPHTTKIDAGKLLLPNYEKGTPASHIHTSMPLVQYSSYSPTYPTILSTLYRSLHLRYSSPIIYFPTSLTYRTSSRNPLSFHFNLPVLFSLMHKCPCDLTTLSY